MNTRSSHTHCQVAQADTQAKTWQRVYLPHPEKIELKKFPFPAENNKYATEQFNDRQKSVAMQTPKQLTIKRFNYKVDRRPACNNRLAQWQVTWLIEHTTTHQHFWCIDSLVLRNPLLRQAPKRKHAGWTESTIKDYETKINFDDNSIRTPCI
jgi:hypothetical protein